MMLTTMEAKFAKESRRPAENGSSISAFYWILICGV